MPLISGPESEGVILWVLAALAVLPQVQVDGLDRQALARRRVHVAQLQIRERDWLANDSKKSSSKIIKIEKYVDWQLINLSNLNPFWVVKF